MILTNKSSQSDGKVCAVSAKALIVFEHNSIYKDR
ncbi:MAG: hypothetical protein K0S74_1210, partial [Chlamydiales bacterium]|nr:hypothetical protein [Chlamydiales bacterium]